MAYGENVSQPSYVTATTGNSSQPRYSYSDNWKAITVWLNGYPAIASRYKYILEFQAPGFLVDSCNSNVRCGPGSVELLKIKDATGDVVNIDYYYLEFTIANPKSDLEAVLNGLRTRINAGLPARVRWSKDTRLFKPHNDIEAALWANETPLGAIIDIIPGWRGLVFDDMTVLVADFCSNKPFGAYWIFSTIWTSWNQYHPVSGNRLFGIERIDSKANKFRFYTSGVDGLTDTIGPDVLYDSMLNRLKLGDEFWRSLFTGFEMIIKSFDPKAKFQTPLRANAKKSDLAKLLGSDVFSN